MTTADAGAAVEVDTATLGFSVGVSTPSGMERPMSPRLDAALDLVTDTCGATLAVDLYSSTPPIVATS